MSDQEQKIQNALNDFYCKRFHSIQQCALYNSVMPTTVAYQLRGRKLNTNRSPHWEALALSLGRDLFAYLSTFLIATSFFCVGGNGAFNKTTNKHTTTIQLLLALLSHCLRCRRRRFLQLSNVVPYTYRTILPLLTAFNKAAHQANFLLPRQYKSQRFINKEERTILQWLSDLQRQYNNLNHLYLPCPSCLASSALLS